MRDYYQESLKVHRKLGGKLGVYGKMELKNSDDLSVAYTPGVAQPCIEIAKNPDLAREYTIKRNTVAVVSDGSAVLGLGNIGAAAAIPVMEGKAILFKKFADIDAFPICLDTQDTNKIIETVRIIAPVFGGINLEDIAAPRCFEVEHRLQDLGIPVFHDDQHGTAIVMLAALLNAAKVIGKPLDQMKVVINGAGAAGIAIAKMLRCINFDDDYCVPVKEIVVCDSKGAIHRKRRGLSLEKKQILWYSNPHNLTGSLHEVITNADVFIGVSIGNLLTAADIRKMNPNAIVLAMANPIPEIMPDEAYAGGAAIVGTGRSDLPNQVNNVLAFPGIFRGALDIEVPSITPHMKLAAAYAIADCVSNPHANRILPEALDPNVATKVAKAVAESAKVDFAEV